MRHYASARCLELERLFTTSGFECGAIISKILGCSFFLAAVAQELELEDNPGKLSQRSSHI